MTRTKLMSAMVCCAMVMTSAAMAQETRDGNKTPPGMKDMPKDIPQEMPGMDSAEMEAWAKAGTPGEMHEWMSKWAGKWDCKNTVTMEGAPPMESQGTMTVEMLMDGRYSHTNYKGDFMGQMYHGMGTMGYNNVTKKFESTWVDNMSTGTMMSKGTLSADKKTLTMEGEFQDPIRGQTIKTREVTKYEGDDKFTMNFYHTIDGKEQKVMEIACTRASKASKMEDEAMKKVKEAEQKMKKMAPGGR